jgi:hypothetical protein
MPLFSKLPSPISTSFSDYPRPTCKMLETKQKLIAFLEKIRKIAIPSIRTLAQMLKIKPEHFIDLHSWALPLSFLSLNVNLSHTSNMLEHIRQAIGVERPTVIHLQGLYEPDENIPLSAFLQLFQSLNYNVSVQSYYDDVQSIWYIIAIDNYRFEFISKQTRYVSRTPDNPTVREGLTDDEIRANNFGEIHERCVLIVQAIDRATGRTFYLFNFHQGFPSLTIDGTEMIKSWIEELAPNKKIGYFASGIFNTFPGSGGEEQIAIMNSIKDVFHVRMQNVPRKYDLVISDRKYFEQVLAGLELGTPEYRSKIIEIWKDGTDKSHSILNYSQNHIFISIPDESIISSGTILSSRSNEIVSDQNFASLFTKCHFELSPASNLFSDGNPDGSSDILAEFVAELQELLLALIGELTLDNSDANEEVLAEFQAYLLPSSTNE